MCHTVYLSSADDKITFSDFLVIMYEQHKNENPFKEIMDAFRLTDTQNRGFILASEFRNIMSKFGEKISDKEGMYRYHSPGGGKEGTCPRIKYKMFS